MRFAIVVPWHNQNQLDAFLASWCVDRPPDWLIPQQDPGWKSCAKTKNEGIRRALEAGAEYIVVIDDDCYPAMQGVTLDKFAEAHIDALQPQPVTRFRAVTVPPSRGTPYFNRTIEMPVAASMGFWEQVPDLDAPAQLVRGQLAPMSFKTDSVYGQYFPLCGMNIAFRAEEFPWCQFIDVPRFDDIWSGFLWQRKAYADGKCFNLNGPTVRHARQSNVWANLRDEAVNLERNETIWQSIAQGPLLEYGEMLKLHGLTLDRDARRA